MAALDVDAAFDLDERAARGMREVRAPLALRVESKFPLKLRPAE
jgi:hypothetical protein